MHYSFSRRLLCSMHTKCYIVSGWNGVHCMCNVESENCSEKHAWSHVFHSLIYSAHKCLSTDWLVDNVPECDFHEDRRQRTGTLQTGARVKVNRCNLQTRHIQVHPNRRLPLVPFTSVQKNEKQQNEFTEKYRIPPSWWIFCLRNLCFRATAQARTSYSYFVEKTQPGCRRQPNTSGNTDTNLWSILFRRFSVDISLFVVCVYCFTGFVVCTGQQ